MINSADTGPKHLGRRQFLFGGAAAVAAYALPGSQVLAQVASSALPPLRILFFTDVHAMSEEGAPEKMAETARRIANEPCDLIIGGGDYLHGGFGSTREQMTERMALFRSFLTQMNRSFRPMIGNHDLVGAMPQDGSPAEVNPRAAIMELLGLERSFYSFEAGAYRVFILDSVEIVGGELRYRGWVGEPQLAWLRETLKSTPTDQPLILCSHVPLRTTFMQDREGPTAALPANLVVGNANEVLGLFSVHRLVAVLQGHLHTDEQIRWNGLEFVQGGAVSGGWWQGANRGTKPGYGVLQLGPSPAGWGYANSP